jgi:hypothetical protein
MTGLLAALVVVAGALPPLLIGLEIWFQISCPGRLAEAARHAACRSERGRSSSSSSRRSAAPLYLLFGRAGGQVS